MVAEKRELNIGEQDQKLNKKDLDHTQKYWDFQREDLSSNIQEHIKVDKNEITSEVTLEAYLESVLPAKSIVFRALSSLQLQGYHESVLPVGFSIEIKEGKLSIFKEDSSGSKSYYKAETGKVIQDLPLLEVIPHQSILYFRSGESRESIPLKKVSRNKTEARQMVSQALEENRFAKLTGMVNGVKISDKVRLGDRHVIAAKEILFLLEKTPHIFDQATLDWIHKNSNLEHLKSLAAGEWDDMNHRDTETFKIARSADGVVQLTLAWRRLRSVLPSSIIKEIREGGLEIQKLAPLTMNLSQTKSTSGSDMAEDRKVMVETIVLRPNKSQAALKLNPSTKQSDKKIKKILPDLISLDTPSSDPISKESQEEAEVTLNNDKDLSQERIKEASKTPEQISSEAWEVQQSLLDYLINEYPGLKFEVKDEGNSTKRLEFIYQPEYLTDKNGKALEIKRTALIKLPVIENADPVFEMEGLKNPQNLADIVQNFVEDAKQQIEPPAKLQLEALLQNFFNRLSRKEKRVFAQTGRLENQIDELRQYYKPRSLKLDVLLGLTTEFETGLFTGGLLGTAPIKIAVSKPKDEIGLEISGGKIKKQIFYSLESNTQYELDQK